MQGLLLHKKIGVTGFEPATSRPPAVRSNQTEPYPEINIELQWSDGLSDHLLLNHRICWIARKNLIFPIASKDPYHIFIHNVKIHDQQKAGG